MEINLNNHTKKGSRVLSGRNEGKEVRKKFSLELIDRNNENVTVIFPDDIISLNSSFFLGLFGPSVRFLGKHGFQEKYRFICPEFVKKSIEDGIERAIKTSNPLDKENE